jgi:DUF4097 and DUF4098 domain-containing protein YvlB
MRNSFSIGTRVAATLAITLAIAVGLSGCGSMDFGPSDRFHEDFHYTFPVGQNARVEAVAFNGSIEISGWDRPDVEITGSKYGSSEAARDAVKVDVHHTADSVEVRAGKPQDLMGNSGAKLVIHVPRSAVVARAETSNGPIKVEDVGRVDRLHTSNGPIKVSGAESLGEAETSNGGITARLAGSPSDRIKLITSNGPIDFTMEKAPAGDIHAETANGPITLHLPADTAAQVTADTSNSPIDCAFDIQGEHDKGHLSGTIGAGSHKIHLNTSNGPIRIAKGM